MNKYGYCKGTSVQTREEIRGYYACLPQSNCCNREYIVSQYFSYLDATNVVKMVEIIPNSMKRYIGQDRNENEVFEGDHVRLNTTCQGDPLEITCLMYYSDWIPRADYLNDSGLTMWNEERNIYLDECELI